MRVRRNQAVAKVRLRRILREAGSGGRLRLRPLAVGRPEPDTSGTAAADFEGQLRPETEGALSPLADAEHEVAVNERVDLSQRQTPDIPGRWRRRWMRLRRVWRAFTSLGWLSTSLAALRDVLAAVWHARPWRTRTPDEIARLEEAKRRKRERKIYMRDAMEYWGRLSAALERLGYAKRPSQRERYRGVHRVGFDRVVLQPEAIYFRVDTAHLPHGVAIVDLIREDVLRDLSLACGRRVGADYSEARGVWYVVERSIGSRGIPKHVRYADMMDSMPRTAHRLVVPLGMTTNSQAVYRSLASFPHLLLAGTTGGGKSNMINVMLLTLLRRNTPKQMRLILIDLKGGMELGHYRGVPHLLGTLHEEPVGEGGIVTDADTVPDILRLVVREADRRMRIITDAGYSDVGDYNARRRPNDQLPRLLVVFDEMASVSLLNPKAGRQTNLLLADLGNRGRAVGIHLIVSTQYPNRQVIDASIKSVLNAKLAFSCSTLAASMTILGNGAAVGLPKGGRYVYQSGDESIVIQGPYMPKSLRDKLLDAIREGGGVQPILRPNQHDVTPDEILTWALEHNGGNLQVRRLYRVFSERGLSQPELLSWLQSWDGKIFRIGDGMYRVVNPGRPQQPRHLEVVSDDMET